MALVTTENGQQVEIEAGVDMYFDGDNGSYYVAWDEVDRDVQRKAIKIQEKMEVLAQEAAALVMSVGFQSEQERLRKVAA
ncbi:hypothetical protein Dalk_2430 [Desulfatibacillum aliphaticivorans]|uniref:Uncharacterized protein n=1 Tax=Desulfatibacillum aliphaticivorans TaxID=218208 RepID=B8FB37_DESAL|nr:hypothetical protein [Desulfatibacillum aliphaticivorans]ACL04123.1 hypothetical protein Dalk_2430 [Desulfatibacillum aliphaticivorans]